MWVLFSIFCVHSSSPFAACYTVETALIKETGVKRRRKARNQRNARLARAVLSNPGSIRRKIRGRWGLGLPAIARSPRGAAAAGAAGRGRRAFTTQGRRVGEAGRRSARLAATAWGLKKQTPRLPEHSSEAISYRMTRLRGA